MNVGPKKPKSVKVKAKTKPVRKKKNAAQGIAEVPMLEWSIEQVQAAHDEAIKRDPSRKFDPNLPLFQWFGLQSIELYREAFADDPYALMQAVRVCANYGLVMPDWVARAYIAAYDKVLNFHVKTWDEAFGKPFPKGGNLNASRKKRVLMFAVLNEIHERKQREPKQPVDAVLFESVGKEFGIGKTLAQEYYYCSLSLLR